ncbi:MAG: c-type cytochrome biogenesis protein CcmI [Pseudomonadota bacterium]
MTFWIVASLLALAVSLILALTLLGVQGDRSAASAPAGPHGGADGGAERVDIALYRDQLAAVERDLERGTVTADEADRLRIEIKRRLLEADRTAAARGPQTRKSPAALSGAVAVLSGVVVVGGSLGLYWLIGAPGYPDLPRAARLEAAADARATRPSQAQAEAGLPPAPERPISEDHAALVAQLRTAVADRPDDLQGRRLLARNEAVLGNFVAAHRAQAEVLRILGDEATAGDYADLGDLLVLAAGGYVSPEAEAALTAALDRDPANGAARYYLGLMQLQTGRPDRAFQIWEAQLRAGPAEAPWIPPIRTQIGEAAARAGIDYSLPPAGADTAPQRGPTAADVAAAEDMSPAQRMQMIEGMVTGLSERLATEGGTPQDWARLIRALGVLGERERAAAIWAEAQQVFPDGTTIIPVLRAARDAGVAE